MQATYNSSGLETPPAQPLKWVYCVPKLGTLTYVTELSESVSSYENKTTLLKSRHSIFMEWYGMDKLR